MAKKCKNCKEVVVEKCDDTLCPFILPAKCVEVQKSYACIGFTKGKGLDIFHDKLMALVCSLEAAVSCTKVSESDACCGYLEDKIASTTLTIEKVVSNAGCEILKIEQNNPTITFLCSPNTTIPISKIVVQHSELDPAIGTDIKCANFNTGGIYPSPQGEAGSGIPIIGKAASGVTIGWNEVPNSNTFPSMIKPTTTSYVRTGVAIQGIVAGTYTNAVFNLKAGIYNISINYAITNGGAPIGDTGYLLFLLNFLTGSPQLFTSTYVLPVKEVVICNFESRVTNSSTVTGIVLDVDSSLMLRLVNTVAGLTTGTLDNITISFQKIK